MSAAVLGRQTIGYVHFFHSFVMVNVRNNVNGWGEANRGGQTLVSPPFLSTACRRTIICPAELNLKSLILFTIFDFRFTIPSL